MDIDQLRSEYSIRGKYGIPFLLAATILWLCFGILYLQPVDLRLKNAIMLMMTALLFPLAVVISSVMKAEWRQKGNPLNGLGLVLNFAQFIYFPIVFWAFLEMPDKMLVMFAIITGAHFFPYGWFYQVRGYYVMAFVIAFTMMLIGWIVSPAQLWMVPLLMSIFLVILIFWLWIDYKRKSASLSSD